MTAKYSAGSFAMSVSGRIPASRTSARSWRKQSSRCAAVVCSTGVCRSGRDRKKSNSLICAARCRPRRYADSAAVTSAPPSTRRAHASRASCDGSAWSEGRRRCRERRRRRRIAGDSSTAMESSSTAPEPEREAAAVGGGMARRRCSTKSGGV